MISLDFELHSGHPRPHGGRSRRHRVAGRQPTDGHDSGRIVRQQGDTRHVGHGGAVVRLHRRRGEGVEPRHPPGLPRGAPRSLPRADRAHRGRRPAPSRRLAGGPARQDPGAGAGVAHLLALLLPRAGPRRRRLPGRPRGGAGGCCHTGPAAAVPRAPAEPVGPRTRVRARPDGLRVLPRAPTRLGSPVAARRRLGAGGARRPTGLDVGGSGLTHLRLG